MHSWGVLFSHPADFTPVCTTELGAVARLVKAGEFAKRNVKVIALSCNDVDTHKGWIADICASQKVEGDFPYPIIDDSKRDLAVTLGMLDPDERDAKGLPAAARAVFVIGPDKKLKLSILYPATTGRNFNELLRVIDSLQLTAKYKVATPADWKDGDDVIIGSAVSDDEAKNLFPNGWTTVKPYLRVLPQPNK